MDTPGQGGIRVRLLYATLDSANMVHRDVSQPGGGDESHGGGGGESSVVFVDLGQVGLPGMSAADFASGVALEGRPLLRNAQVGCGSSVTHAAWWLHLIEDLMWAAWQCAQ